MKNSGYKDERLTAENQKLNSHGFLIVLVGLLISIMVKVFILQWDIKYWLDVFLILMAACLYITVKGIRSGLYLLSGRAGEKQKFKKANLLSGAIGATVWTVLMISYDLLESGTTDLFKNVASALAGGVIFFFGINWIQRAMMSRSTQNADKPLD
ncbi:DUF6773 family protein [Paenibacillus sp. P46E]|uniref:DUF6773 family protein n=1 Tax=Paenibacillus sp. P46E TaxID=1349436 RepID=UPI00093C0365|nr:DUF6773 family protein [Paenibacillus sp. P46E]OKP96697.1 hypothetical protein A3849_19765 [Paenibacillus sp. P46E]